MLCGFGGYPAANVLLAVSDIEILFSISSGIQNVGIVFNYTIGGFGNHELIKRHKASYILMGFDDADPQVQHTGEWTESAVTGSQWEVACTSEDVGTWDVSHAAVGVYTTFATTDMDWHEHRDGAKNYSAGTSTVTATFRIREVADTNNFVDFEVKATAIQT